MPASRASAEFKARFAVALDANGGNVKRTLKALGPDPETGKVLAVSTAYDWRDRYHADPESFVSADELEDKHTKMTAQLERIAFRLLNHVEENIEDVKAKDAMVMFGISVEKLALLQGRPTSRREEVKTLSPEQIDQLAQRLPQAWNQALERSAEVAAVEAELVEEMKSPKELAQHVGS